MRIHIGKISDSLASSKDDLERMLDRFGHRNSKVELHRKMCADFHFAYVDMDISLDEFKTLKHRLNNTVFKQSKLEIDIAKPAYWPDLSRLSTPKPFNETQLKRVKCPPRQVDVYNGELKNNFNPRFQPTFRVLINNKLKKPRQLKKKLWGIEKRPIERLTYEFNDGEWRDSEGKAVEINAQLNDEHAKAREIAEKIDKTAYLSDSDFEEFKQTANLLENTYSDDEIEVVPRGGESESADLKSVFKVDRPFTLFADQPDIQPGAQAVGAGAAGTGADVNMTGTHMTDTPTDTTATLPPTKPLFFTHKESPFLNSQSQFAKLNGHFNLEEWESAFFTNRSAFKQDLKKRRRDALRMSQRMGKKRGE